MVLVESGYSALLKKGSGEMTISWVWLKIVKNKRFLLIEKGA